MIIRLSLCGVSSGNIRMDLCKLLLFENDIGNYRLVPNLDSEKLELKFDIWFCFEHFTERLISF